MLLNVEGESHTRLPEYYTRGRAISSFRQLLNFLGCLAILPCFYLIVGRSRYPMTLDILFSIFLTEFNRYANEGRRSRFSSHQTDTGAVYDTEKAPAPTEHGVLAGAETMAAVVGYREDPALFTRALESYKSARGCVFTLVSIDGDAAEDLEMMRVFCKVRTLLYVEIPRWGDKDGVESSC